MFVYLLGAVTLFGIPRVLLACACFHQSMRVLARACRAVHECA
jgi:hypothetical protein